MLGPGIKGVDLRCNVSTGVSKCLQRWYSTKFRLGCLWPELKHFDGGDVMLNSRHLNIKKSEGKRREVGEENIKKVKNQQSVNQKWLFWTIEDIIQVEKERKWVRKEPKMLKCCWWKLQQQMQVAFLLFRCRHCDLNTLKQRNYYTPFFLLNAYPLI